MLTAAEQEQIIKANNEAFEELAVRWRNPQTGETEPDLRVAIRQLVCDYFSVAGCSLAADRLYSLIAGLQNAALKEDARMPIEPTEEDIPSETRIRIKALYTDPDPGHWDWDDGQWDWELSLRDAQEDVEAGYVAVVPLKNGRRFEYEIKPPFSHDEWAINIVGAGFDCPTILVKGSLQEAKRKLDLLLRADTPEISTLTSSPP
jgi:hypothetical protein